MLNKKFFIFSILFIIAANLIVYSNTFNNEFVWDDRVFIEENIQIRSFENIDDVFSKPALGNLYRPLRSVLYMVVYKFSGLNPIGYHLNALFWHTLISVLVFFITYLMFNKKFIALFSSLLFVVHPLHAERVANMTAGFDLLGIFFYFLCFLLFILFRKTKQKKYFAYLMISFILGLLSSEELITLPLVLLFYDVCFYYKFDKLKEIFIKKNIFRIVKDYYVYFIVFIGYFIVRTLVLGRIGRVTKYLAGDTYHSVISTIPIIWKYATSLIFPINLTLDPYVKIYSSIFDFFWILAFVGLIFVFISIFKSYKNDKNIFFLSLWFFITLFPFLNLFPLLTLMEFRYLYLPSFSIVLIIPFILSRFLRLKFRDKKLRVVFVVVIILIILFSFSFISFKRSLDYQDDFTLWTKTVKTSPLSSRAHDNLAWVYLNDGDYNKAVYYSSKAIELEPKNKFAYNTLGTAHAFLGNYTKAATHFEQAVLLDKFYAKAIANLALAYFNLGMTEEAIYHFNDAIEKDPSNYKTHNYFGSTYASLGMFEQAEVQFNKALEINPYYGDAYVNLGLLYFKLDKVDEAMQYFIYALDVEPDNSRAFNGIGTIHVSGGDFVRAERAFSIALDIDPNYDEAAYNLALLREQK